MPFSRFCCVLTAICAMWPDAKWTIATPLIKIQDKQYFLFISYGNYCNKHSKLATWNCLSWMFTICISLLAGGVRSKLKMTRLMTKMACEPSEDSDQPGHPPSLIRVFDVRVTHESTVARTVMCRQDGRGRFPVLLDDHSKCRTNSQTKSQLS